MNDSVALNKAQRLQRMCHLLYRNPHGLTVSELAQLSSVSKRTIQRDLADLQDVGIPVWSDEGEAPSSAAPRYGIIEGYYLPPIHLTLDNAVALYLAGRLLARYADTFGPHVADALAKLAGILPEPISGHIHATIRDLATRERDERFVSVLGTLALGWATGSRAGRARRSYPSRS